ncbi:MAG TPA: ATP-binding cassette domain-containing protein [Candidatus Dormibacteraeota bacterium]
MTVATAAEAPAARLDEATVQHVSEGEVVTALDSVTVAIPRRCFTVVTGRSGSGKSTLIRVLAGLQRLTSGSVYIGEVSIGDLNEDRLTVLRRERVAVIFQAFNLLPQLNVEANLRLPLELAGRALDQAWMEEVVTRLNLAGRLRRAPAQLSGGERQRAAAARALISRPELILADEPTGNLDRRHGAELIAILREAVTEMGQTVLMVTHDEPAAAAADHHIHMTDGRVTSH